MRKLLVVAAAVLGVWALRRLLIGPGYREVMIKYSIEVISGVQHARELLKKASLTEPERGRLAQMAKRWYRISWETGPGRMVVPGELAGLHRICWHQVMTLLVSADRHIASGDTPSALSDLAEAEECVLRFFANV